MLDGFLVVEDVRTVERSVPFGKVLASGYNVEFWPTEELIEAEGPAADNGSTDMNLSNISRAVTGASIGTRCDYISLNL